MKQNNRPNARIRMSWPQWPCFIVLGIAAFFAHDVPAQNSPGNAPTDTFVARAGTKLALNGKTFRYSGPNIEWLGLEGYGPHDPMGPHYPTRFEVEDAFATAEEMGAVVVRSQTMGDSVGCPLCIEPEDGKFNDNAFQSTDYALSRARQHGMKVILTLVGDCAMCDWGGIGQYLAWKGKKNLLDFFTDPALITAFELHIDHVLNHVNPLTGVAYKDDPTILAWENCNMCGIVTLFTGADATSFASISQWVEVVGKHIKQVDPRHLYLDTSGIFRSYAKVLDNPSTDIVTFEYYPHWDVVFGAKEQTTAATFSRDAATVTAHGKAYIVNEFGWDRTDWKAPKDLQDVLDTLARDEHVSGDDFWALQAHLDGFGFQPIPANTNNATFAEHGESGQWWALYYPGLQTLINTSDDMAARAQQLRAHAYAMLGQTVPKHRVPPPPVITTVIFGLIAWRGSAGAVRYSVERMDQGSDWKAVCDRCATDADDPWIDPHPAFMNVHYRVIAWNADGVASPPSNVR